MDCEMPVSTSPAPRQCHHGTFSLFSPPIPHILLCSREHVSSPFFSRTLRLLNNLAQVMNGYQATSLLRDMYPSNCPVVVGVTAKTLPDDRLACFHCGMHDYVPKPVTADTFFQVFHKWIDRIEEFRHGQV